MKKHLLAFSALFAVTACANTGKQPFATLEVWGGMREVLRQERAEGRVPLRQVDEAGNWGLGALEDLAGEVTILDGEVFVSTVEEGALVHRNRRRGDWASLLMVANAKEWNAYELLELRGLADLEAAIEVVAREAGFDPDTSPVPLRLDGTMAFLELHVIDGACPIANPDGPPPWRWIEEGVPASLVGVYAHGEEGQLTHHGRRTHLHAVVHAADGSWRAGHVDQLSLGADVRLLLPKHLP